MKFLILALMSMLLTFQSAFGKTDSPNGHFRPLSKTLVDRLIARDIQKVGKLDLKKLSQELDSVEWRIFDLGFLGGSGGKRMTSIYTVQDKMVVINMYSLKNLVGKPVSLYAWALHEGMGALGYNDENYELSSSISFLEKIKDEDELDLAMKLVKANFEDVSQRTDNRVYLMAGGSTVVGGGGDAGMIEFKHMLLMRLFNKIKYPGKYLEASSYEAFHRLLVMEMEFTLESQMSVYEDVGFEYTFKDGTLIINAAASLMYELFYSENYITKIENAIENYLWE